MYPFDVVRVQCNVEIAEAMGGSRLRSITPYALLVRIVDHPHVLGSVKHFDYGRQRKPNLVIAEKGPIGEDCHLSGSAAHHLRDVLPALDEQLRDLLERKVVNASVAWTGPRLPQINDV